MDAIALGWCVYTSHQPNSTESRERVARITAAHRSHYEGYVNGMLLRLRLTGRLLHVTELSTDLPTVGDWCAITEVFRDEDGNASALVTAVLPRFSQLVRAAPGDRGGSQLLAANVDSALIVSSANAELNLNRIHRYCAICRQGGVAPVLVVSKADLLVDQEPLVAEFAREFPGLPVYFCSALTGAGLEELRSQLSPGVTLVLLGSSGVGKSSLVNCFLEQSVQRTQSVREDAKGRHTTTSRQLFALPGGGLMIDTPGLREVGIEAGSFSAAGSEFAVIEAAESQCRFHDCAHGSEPGCAVQAAIAAGEITEALWENYSKLSRERAFIERKQSKQLASNAKKRWKEINKANRARNKMRLKR